MHVCAAYAESKAETAKALAAARQAGPFKVFITSAAAAADSTSGFVSADAHMTLLIAELRKRLPKKERGMKGGVLALTDDRTAAQLVIEIGRDDTKPTGKKQRYYHIGGVAVPTGTTTETTVLATLIVGEFRKPMENRGEDLDYALWALCRDVEAFVISNVGKFASQH